MKIVTIVGARPNFVKLQPLSKELRKSFDEVLVHSGQHYDFEMSEIFFKDLNIPEPDYFLGVGSKSHCSQIGEMLIKLESVLIKEIPDLVIVFGDTNSTLAGALAAAKLNFKLAHIESGMRSFDRKMPEEINRVIIDHISDMLFCSTKTAVNNLIKEGIKSNLFLVGDVMIDSIIYNMKNAEKKGSIFKRLNAKKKIMCLQQCIGQVILTLKKTYLT